MSPCSPQPKQCHVSRSGVTMNDGVFSPWKGQSPFETLPARLSATVSPTISRTGSLDLISATMPEEVGAMVRVPSAVMRLSIAERVPRGSFYHLSSAWPNWRLLVARLRLGDRGLGGGEAGDRHTER